MQELLQEMPAYTFEDEACKCTFSLYEPGVYLIRAEGELTQAGAIFLCETLPRLQAWLMAQPALVYFVVDIQCTKATATARNYILRQLRWKLSGRVVKCYIYFSVPLARALLELLAKINHRTSFENITHWSEGVDKARAHQQAFVDQKRTETSSAPISSLPEMLQDSELKVYFRQSENKTGSVRLYRPDTHCLYLYFSGKISRPLIQHAASICRGLLQDMPIYQNKHTIIIDIRHTSQIAKSAIFEAYRQSLTQEAPLDLYLLGLDVSNTQHKKQNRWLHFMASSIFKNLFLLSDDKQVMDLLLKKVPLDLVLTQVAAAPPQEELMRLRKWCEQQEQLLLDEREQHAREMEQIRNILWMLLLRESRSPLQVKIPGDDAPSSDTLQLLDVFQQDQFQLIKDLQHQIDERTRAEQRAAYANEIKGEFLASMSHEIRTPLNAILGFTTVLKSKKNPPLTSEQMLYLSRIQENGAHLLALVNNILDLSELEAGKLKVKQEKVLLGELVTRIVNQLRVLIDNKGLNINLILCEGFLDTDAQRLQQIIVNLLNNAIKFTDYGSITLRCECRSDRIVALHVEDTGCGISPEAQARIFEAFEQERSAIKKEGSGLGLAICTRLCNHLGYHLRLRSTPEQGSVFSLYFQPRE